MRVYGDAEQWTVIHKANPTIKNPNLIFPGQMIELPITNTASRTFADYYETLRFADKESVTPSVDQVEPTQVQPTSAAAPAVVESSNNEATSAAVPAVVEPSNNEATSAAVPTVVEPSNNEATSAAVPAVVVRAAELPQKKPGPVERQPEAAPTKGVIDESASLQQKTDNNVLLNSVDTKLPTHG